MVKQQTKLYHAYHQLVQDGDYYRIASYQENHLYDCWAVSAKDGSEVLVTYVQVLGRPNVRSRKLCLRGFDPEGTYRLDGTDERYTGEMLLYGGMLIRDLQGDFRSRLYHFVRE